MRKIKIRWTCSDRAHHEHRWKWTAWLCGRIQFLKARLPTLINSPKNPG